MFNPLTSSSSSLSYSSYEGEGQDPAKFLVMAQQELSLRYLQERLMARPLIGGPIMPTPLATHFFPGRDHYSIVSPFLGNPVGPLPATSALVHNPFPASTKLSSLQGQKQLNSLFHTGSRSNFSSYLANHVTTSQLPVLAPASMSQAPKDFMGSFHVKNFSATSFNPFYNPLGQLLTTNQKKDGLNIVLRKHGRWSVAHVRIAWEIHLDQQRKIQSTTREERKEEIPNQSAGTKMKTNSDIQFSKKRRIPKSEKEILDTLGYSATSNDHQGHNTIPEKKKFAKLTHEHIQPTSPQKISEQLPAASEKRHHHRTATQQSEIQLTDASDSNEVTRPALLNDPTRNQHLSSPDDFSGESLINLLKATDTYANVPGVVTSLSNEYRSFPQHRYSFQLNL